MPAPARAASTSPLPIAFPPEAAVEWTSAGRRVGITVSPGRGLERAWSGGRTILEATRVTAGGRVVGAGLLTATPSGVRRWLAPGIEERWIAAIDLPIVVWELEAPGGVAISLEASLGKEWARADTGEHAVGAVSTAPTLRLVTGDGRLLLIRCDGPGSALTMASPGPVRVLGEAHGSVRLTFLAAENAEDFDRTVQLLERKGPSGLYAQRAQHARLIRDYGVAISTPLPALDEAFEWAKLRADELAPSGPASLPELQAILQRPGALSLEDPAGLINGVLQRIWGVHVDADRSALRLAAELPPGWGRMELLRLRVGPATLDFVMSRRAGRVTLRVRRRSGPAVTLTLELPGVTIAALAIDGIPVGGPLARLEAAGEHEVVFDLAE